MKDLILHRIGTHLLQGKVIYSPYEVVNHMLCLQSQDLTQNKRAIASRAGCSHDAIVASFNAGEIVRTWTQRGTIHTVSAQDTGWLVKLCATKTLGGFQKRRAYLGISEEIAEKSIDLIRTYLGDGPKTRTEIGVYLAESGIPMQPNWIYHLLCYAGTLGVTVQGPLLDGDHAFVLADQWIKNPVIYTEEQSLRELCLRYFSSHGPATVEDLQRRSGLGKTQIKQGILLCDAQLIQKDGYYSSPEQCLPEEHIPTVHFLAGFDEWLLGYKDRTATLALEHHTGVDVSRNGIFKPTVMIDGITVGIRMVKHKSKVSEITIKPFAPITSVQATFLTEHIAGYQNYLAKEVTVSIL